MAGTNARKQIFEDEPGWDPGTMGNRKGFTSDGRWVDNSGGGDPNAGRPGYVMAEDGSWVPESFYSNSRDPYYRGQAIEW